MNTYLARLMRRAGLLLASKPLLTAVLVLVAIMLFLFTPHRFNLLVLQLVRFAILALGTGAVALALAQRRLRPTGPALLAALSAWLLLPLVTGPLTASLAELQLMNYYHSADFRRVNSTWQGVKMDLHDQQFGFAPTSTGARPDGPSSSAQEVQPAGIHHCVINSYTATYTIDASRDQELTFALVRPDGAQTFDGADPAVQSIQRTFAQVGPGHAEGAYWQGLFRVGSGSHTLIVQGRTPFLLQVYGAEPLWTPDFVLAGKRRYAPLYADAFSSAGFEAAAQPFMPASCTPLGCPDEPKGLFGLVIPPTTGASAHIGKVVDEHVVDADGDGLYDTLELVITLDIRLTGQYVLEGTLDGSDGGELVKATYATEKNNPLCYGERMVKLVFFGRRLSTLGVDGPYTLGELRLSYQESDGYRFPQQVDFARDFYTTAPFSADEFQSLHP